MCFSIGFSEPALIAHLHTHTHTHTHTHQNEEVEEKAAEVLPSGLLEQLANTNWKERLAGHEQFKEFVEGLQPQDMQSLLFVKVLARKPGWKEQFPGERERDSCVTFSSGDEG